ncbi:hypothetical protein ACEWY4_013408 [Coilia grayii]|uniref:C1q domain-containing protein n=1 Tax=Coilia grayii TaxID=363190 RepID=A0ABD1JWB9_9TELE
MMKTIAVLFLALGCCLCEPQNSGHIQQSGGSTSSCIPCSCPKDDDYLARKVALLESKLQKTEKDVSELRSLVEGRPQVAFSAALLDSGNGNVGPFPGATPLKYKKVFSNTGSSYNPSTGIFTALVKGMYFFRLSMFNQQIPTPKSVVNLMKNSQIVATIWDMGGTDLNDTGSNAVVIPLDVGDNVYVQLMAAAIIYDDSNLSLTTFTGFLLFTM